MRLLHVESDELILLGLRRAAPSNWDITSVQTVKGVPRLPAEGTWDACLLGVGDDDAAIRNALSCLVQLNRSDCPLLVWMPPDAADYIPAMRALGVMGCLSRSASFEELSAAIQDVVDGHTFIDHRLQCGACDEGEGLADLGLTPAQERVAALYVLHGTRRLVAQDLLVTENTVKYHLHLIYRKTGTSSLHGLHQLLRSRGWAPRDCSQSGGQLSRDRRESSPEPLRSSGPAEDPLKDHAAE